MNKLKDFKNFINESLSDNTIVDLYQYFMKILKIHEKHF